MPVAAPLPEGDAAAPVVAVLAAGTEDEGVATPEVNGTEVTEEAPLKAGAAVDAVASGAMEVLFGLRTLHQMSVS